MAEPGVSGPITGGKGVATLLGHTSFDLASVGYETAEFLLAGTVEAYQPKAPLTTDGCWTVQPASKAVYATRVVVNRPSSASRYNGTVVVEWLNVSGQVDASPSWIFLHDEIIRRGYAYVAVSAQAVGLESTRGADPARYEALTHPGDSYSYDVFSQAGRAVRGAAGLLLGGLPPERVIGTGESQSGRRLVTYIDAVHPLARVYDGFLVGSRQAPGAELSQDPLPVVAPPAPTRIRTDLETPVLVFQSETDVDGLRARQDDGPFYRLWEVAGSSHYDLYGLSQGADDRGGEQSVADWFDAMRSPPAQPSPFFRCGAPVNTGPRTFVQRAALAALDRWLRDGTPPPEAPRLETLSVEPPEYALDANGNVRGGVRSPAVDAPVATLSGLGQDAEDFCRLFGTTVPFSAEKLAALYPGRGDFVSAWQHATREAERAGFLLPEDARLLEAVAAKARF